MARLLTSLKTLISVTLSRTPLTAFPVRVRSGLAQGARWTALPHSGYWRGHLEHEVERAVQQHVKPGDACWDLGTHFGIYTVGMAMRVGPQGQVAGFEPSPVPFGKCSQHVRMNRLQNVKLFNVAVSNSTQTAELIFPNGKWETSAHLPLEDQSDRNVYYKEANATRLTVQQVRLDDLVDAGEIRAPNFIKIDVEGFGAKAIQGGLRAIAASRPVIVMSFHSSWELDETRAALEPLGYSAAWDKAAYQTALLLPGSAT